MAGQPPWLKNVGKTKGGKKFPPDREDAADARSRGPEETAENKTKKAKKHAINNLMAVHKGA